MTLTKQLALSLLAFLALLHTASAQYPDWQHSGSLYLLTTPEGANLPSSASETNFPVLVRLTKEWFDFSQAKAHGEDVRFSSAGNALAYQIEEWNANAGSASVWVRIPVIKGNTNQAFMMHWGKAGATNESSGASVFNSDNGFVTVMHLDQALNDEVGSVVLTNAGTTTGSGIIGKGRHVVAGQSLCCGETIMTFPTNANPNSTAAWVKADQYNGTIVSWGRGGQQEQVNIRSPSSSGPSMRRKSRPTPSRSRSGR